MGHANPAWGTYIFHLIVCVLLDGLFVSLYHESKEGKYCLLHRDIHSEVCRMHMGYSCVYTIVTVM